MKINSLQKTIFYLPILILLTLIYSSCSNKDENKEKIVALPVYKVDTTTVEINKNFLGSVEGKINVEIRPQVSGQLDAAYVDEGDYVQKGQKLFKINPLTYQHDLNRALANKNVQLAKLANAKLEVERLKPLIQHEVIAPIRLETAKSNYEIAKAGVRQAAAEVANAKIQLGYTTIFASVSGYIGRIPKRIGNLVSPGDAEPITVLSDVHEVYVYFSISESNFYELLRTQEDNSNKDSFSQLIDTNSVVSLILSDGSLYPYKGNIDASSGQIDKSTGSILLRANFPNHKNILRSGNTGTIILTKQQKGVIVIPQKATFTLQAKTFVKKLDKNNHVIRQLIKVEHEAPNNQYIVSAGLKPGDRILVEGMSHVGENVKIRPMPYRPDSLVAPKVFETVPDSNTSTS